jgi:predicted nuclease of predicted toxin-antitoxin system
LRIKLDENIGRRGVELLRARGHDVMTVLDQNLRGVTDETLFDVCIAEERALITLDRDFGQILRFPPSRRICSPRMSLAAMDLAWGGSST